MLTLGMVLGGIPFSFVSAATGDVVVSGNCGASANTGGEESVTWQLIEDGTLPGGTDPAYRLVISGTGAMADYTSYGATPWSDYRTSIMNIQLGEGITHIGDCAFGGCSLQDITIPSGVISLGNKAFQRKDYRKRQRKLRDLCLCKERLGEESKNFSEVGSKQRSVH